MSTVTDQLDATTTAAADFPEIEITVAPITERSRATFAKTHTRPMIASFSEMLGDESK